MEQLRKRVELKDPAALINLAMAHGRGELGLPVNQATCVQLLRQAAGLDCPAAKFGEMGLRMDEGEALRYMVVSAEGGDLDARHNLGCAEGASGDDVAAMRHWRLSASGGVQAVHGRSSWML